MREKAGVRESDLGSGLESCILAHDARPDLVILVGVFFGCDI